MVRRARRQARSHDSFGRRAQKEGYPARSIYKLEEIDKRMQLFRRGMRVLDLGASPGSWMLYAAERVGREGKVIGLDLNPARTAMPPQAHFEVADVMTINASEVYGEASFEAVISDMAPQTTGMRDRDQYRSYELYLRALEVAGEVLVPHGFFVGKLFQGAEFDEARSATQAMFKKVRILKPEASRDESFEVFLIGVDRKDGPLAAVNAGAVEPRDGDAGGAR